MLAATPKNLQRGMKDSIWAVARLDKVKDQYSVSTYKGLLGEASAALSRICYATVTGANYEDI